MTSWRIEPETLHLTGPDRKFTEWELDHQHWPPCPACGIAVTVDWVECPPYANGSSMYVTGGWRCPSGCRSRITVTAGILVGGHAHVIVPTRFSTECVVMPAAEIADQANVPVNELPGRKFTALRDGDRLTGFSLAYDPRR
jgi:hypothetical protein